MKTLSVLMIAAVLASGQSLHARPSTTPVVQSLSVNGTNIPYIEQGTGTPVIFVHGAYADHRIWEPQRQAVAQRYRFIALDQRYFGTAPWSDNGVHFSQATHVADLAAFIRALQAGPVHLVGRSYSATIVLITALRHPELVRSVLAHEPSISSLVTDEATQKVIREDRKGLAAVTAAAKAGDAVQATKLLHEFVNDQPGAFDTLPPDVRAMHLDNARTVPLQMAAPAPPPLACAELGQLKVPVTITKGELTRVSYKALAEAAHGCIPGAQLVTIPLARHGAPSQQPAAFNEALLAFLARQ